MTRNLKVLGLALMAAFAMSAVVASAASAQTIGKFTSDGTHFFLTGTELAGGNKLEYPGLPPIACPESHFHGGKLDTTVTPTKHSPLTSGDSSVTIKPTYTNCKVGIFPATVKMTGCDFDFKLGETTPSGTAHTYGLHVQVTCENPATEQIHLEVYSDAGHTKLICSTTFGAQTPHSQLHATDTTNGRVLVKGIITGIHATRTNSGGCPPSNTTNAVVYEVNVELTGENEGGGTTALSISH
jgi:hypothetical protein